MKAEIREVLKEHGRLAVDAATLTDDADLYAAGLTSHASVSLMLGLESKFDIEFPERMLRRKSFESISAMAAAIAELLAEKGA